MGFTVSGRVLVNAISCDTAKALRRKFHYYEQPSKFNNSLVTNLFLKFPLGFL